MFELYNGKIIWGLKNHFLRSRLFVEMVCEIKDKTKEKVNEERHGVFVSPELWKKFEVIAAKYRVTPIRAADVLITLGEAAFEMLEAEGKGAKALGLNGNDHKT